MDRAKLTLETSFTGALKYQIMKEHELFIHEVTHYIIINYTIVHVEKQNRHKRPK